MQKTQLVRRGRRSVLLLATSSVAGVLAAFPAAYGQGQQNSVETVVVTGTSIRGAAPVGSNLITVDRSTIEATGAQTTQELLTYVPQVNINFGSSGQQIEGGGGNESGPTIHSLGSQSANATLVLIDGHRIPPTGQTTAVVDPSIIPAAALERVEVLPDGASSVYGADAVAGVLNFITRKDYTGWETTAQYDYAPEYNGFNIGQLWGKSWTGGSALVAYNYSSLSHLMNKDRAFISTRQDIIRGADATTTDFTALAATPPAGSMTSTPAASAGTTGPFGVAIPYPSTGSNFQNFFCPVATIATGSTAAAFIYPYSGTSISTSQTTPSQGVCDSNSLFTNLPSQTRNSAILSIRQQVTPNITATLDLIYGTIAGTTLNSRGTISATVFGPTGTGAALGTAQRNPFYVGNATTGTASEFIRYDFNQLFGGPATDHNTASNQVAVVGVTWDMGSDWEADLDVDLGQSQSPQITSGGVCTPCSFLALNGTTNSNGSANTTTSTSATPDANGLATVVSVTRALTTANALDVWNPPGSTNRTSAATLNSLLDANTYANGIITLQDYSLKFDGPVVDLWGAGPIKAAVGGEYQKQGLTRITTSDSTIGGSTGFSTQSLRFGISRYNASVFAEFLIPIVHDSDMPLLQEFNINLSGRYDHFSDFGVTYNPKVGFDWTPFDGIKAHGSFSTSFMAPEIISLGGGPGSVQSGGVTNGLIVPFNSTTNYSTNPNSFSGGGIAGTFVSTAAACAAAGSNPVDVNGNTVAATSAAAVACKVNSTNSPGLQLRGTVPDLGPQRGLSWSAGFDLDAGKLVNALSGLVFTATYYNTKFVGYITNQQVNNTVPQTNAFAPIGGWSQTDPVIQTLIAGRQLTLALPATIWTVVDNRVRNAFTLWQEGVDFSLHYTYRTDDWGSFNFGVDGNQIIRFAQGSATTPPVSIVDGRNSGRQTGIELTGTASLGWRMNPFSVQLLVAYAHPYSILNGSFPYNLASSGGRTAGTEHIGPLYNMNLHTTYNLPEDWVSGMQVYLNVNNILNLPPPFADTANGFNSGNQIGREYIVGFKKDF